MSLFKKNLPAFQNHWPSLQSEMNDFFNSFSREQGYMPKLEVSEDEKTYRVSAELPGLKEEDIHVTLKENHLVLEGERKEETKKEDKGFTRTEFNYGCFYRTIPFQAEVNPEKVSAVYKNGILDVTVEKTASALSKTRKIDIRKE